MYMTVEEFLESMSQDRPLPQLPEILTALWWDKKGEWGKAHAIAQNIATVQGSAVHAYLHREEGVMWNADYWYARAGRQRPDMDLEAEWRLLVEEVISH